MKKIFVVLSTLMLCTSSLMAMCLVPVMSGQTNFNNGSLIGSVEYWVCGPDQYPGTTIFPSTDFVYAYRVFNDSASTVSIDFFSVGIQANTTVGNLTYETDAGDVIPGFQSILSETVLNLFSSSAGPITSGKNSAILLFSSPMDPCRVSGRCPADSPGARLFPWPFPFPNRQP